MIRCTKCGHDKPPEEFGRDRDRPSGLTTNCKECLRAYNRDRYRKTIASHFDTGPITDTCEHCGREHTYVKTTGRRRMYCGPRCKANAGAAKTAARRAERVRICTCGSTEVPKVGKPVCRDCRKQDRDRSDYNRRRRLAMYGLIAEQFDELLAMQRERCAVCATDDPGARGWFVDHDHACCPGIGSCGECVRGLVCHDCNILLGNAKDSVETLERAIRYLQVNRLKLRAVPNGD